MSDYFAVFSHIADYLVSVKKEKTLNPPEVNECMYCACVSVCLYVLMEVIMLL